MTGYSSPSRPSSSTLPSVSATDAGPGGLCSEQEEIRTGSSTRYPVSWCSTNRMYDDRWLRFTQWAATEGFDPLSPTSAQIATFLYSGLDTHGLSPQTVKGYRTCLGSVLKWFSTRLSLI